jgi:hypothetical protein
MSGGFTITVQNLLERVHTLLITACKKYAVVCEEQMRYRGAVFHYEDLVVHHVSLSSAKDRTVRTNRDLLDHPVECLERVPRRMLKIRLL